MVKSMVKSITESYPYVFTDFAIINDYNRPKSYYVFNNNYSKNNEIAYYNIWFELNDTVLITNIKEIPYKNY